MNIHRTALVDPKARIANDVVIGPWCVVGPNVEIGPECRLISRVAITCRVKIGARNLFHPTVVVGGPPQDEMPSAEDGCIEIGDDNLFHEAVTINFPKVAGSKTRIGSHNRFHFGSHVAHDVAVGNRVTLAMFSLLGGHTHVGDCVHLEPLVAVHQFVSVGRYVLLRRHSAVSEDAAPFLLFDGIGNRPVGINGIALKRDGFSAATIAALEEAYRTIWNSGLPRPEALQILETESVAEVREMAAFLRRARHGRMGRSREAQRVPSPKAESR